MKSSLFRYIGLLVVALSWSLPASAFVTAPASGLDDSSVYQFSAAWPTVIARKGAVFRVDIQGGLRVIGDDETVLPGEVLYTDRDGSALLGFPDGTQVLLAENTNIHLEQFVFQENKPLLDSLVINLNQGSVRINTGKISKRGDVDALKLKHKNTQILVRGTDFVARVCANDCPPKTGLNLIRSKTSVGRVLAVSGQAGAKKTGAFAGKVPPRELVLGSPLFKDDEVYTGPKSTLQMVFNDEAKVNLEQNSEMLIQDFAMGQGSKDNRFAVRLATGAMRTVTGKIGKLNPDDTNYRTPTLTVGIRGTAFDMVCGKDADCLNSTLIGMREGQVLVESGAYQQAMGPGSFYEFDGKNPPRDLAPAGLSTELFVTPLPESLPNNLLEKMEAIELDSPSGVYLQVNQGVIVVQNSSNSLPMVLAEGEGGYSSTTSATMFKTGVPMETTNNSNLSRFMFLPESCF